jgi:hypothetical protein
MKAMARKAKPEGFEAFDALTRKLVQVPKKEARAAAKKAKRKK